MSEFLEAFADFSLLLYHEARNVRHLVPRYASREKYQKLLILPRKREEAWAKLQPIRQKARHAATAAQVRQMFEQRFELRLRDLEDLFQNPGWHHSALGGNRWADIASTVSDLSVALDEGNLDNARNLLLKLMEMRHNTGILGDKLRELDRSLPWSGRDSR